MGAIVSKLEEKLEGKREGANLYPFSEAGNLPKQALPGEGQEFSLEVDIEAYYYRAWNSLDQNETSWGNLK